MHTHRLLKAVPFLAALALAALPSTADAKVKNVWPVNFEPTTTATNAYRGPEHLVSLTATYASYTAVARLPVGAKITKVVCYTKVGHGNGMSAFLYRRRITQDETDIAGVTTGTINSSIVPVALTISGDPFVRAGYQYFLRVSTFMNVEVKGCSITYR